MSSDIEMMLFEYYQLIVASSEDPSFTAAGNGFSAAGNGSSNHPYYPDYTGYNQSYYDQR